MKQAKKVSQRLKVVAIASPKGGVGKSTIAMHMLVAAQNAGVKVAGLDADHRQGSLIAWADWRFDKLGGNEAEDSAPEENDAVETAPMVGDAADTAPEGSDEVVGKHIDVEPLNLGRWAAVKADLIKEGYGLVIIDTAPGIDAHLEELVGLLQDVDYVIVPTGSSRLDLHSVIPFMKIIRGHDIRARFCLNNTNRQAAAVHQAMAELTPIADVFQLPLVRYETIMSLTGEGLTVFDPAKPHARSVDAFSALWAQIKREISL